VGRQSKRPRPGSTWHPRGQTGPRRAGDRRCSRSTLIGAWRGGGGLLCPDNPCAQHASKACCWKSCGRRAMRLAWLAVIRSAWKASPPRDKVQQRKARVDEVFAFAGLLSKCDGVITGEIVRPLEAARLRDPRPTRACGRARSNGSTAYGAAPYGDSYSIRTICIGSIDARRAGHKPATTQQNNRTSTAPDGLEQFITRERMNTDKPTRVAVEDIPAACA
jgi:hypothetical protein